MRPALTIAALALLSTTPHGVAGQGGGGGQRGAGPGSGGPPPILLPPTPLAPAEGTSAISGIVIDGATKAPVAGGVVYLSNYLPIEGRGSVGTQSRQLTDARGRFAFANLPAGDKYTISASKFGYLDGGYNRDGAPGASGSPIVVRDGEWVADARVTIWHPGAISGTVVDERGEPIVGVYVRALARLRIGGRDELAAGPLTTTDDLGMYRIAGLAPGRYFVEVPSVQASLPTSMTLPSSSQPRTAGPAGPAAAVNDAALDLDPRARLVLRNFPIPPPSVDGQSFAYPITFYPGTQAVSSATAVTLGFGEERSGTDIALSPVPTWRVSGTVDGPAEALTDLTLRLLPEGLEGLGAGSEAATAFVGADGRFTFLNVPAGSYTIDAPRTVSELTTSTGSFNPSATRFPPPPRRLSGWGSMSQGVDAAPPGTSIAITDFRSGSPNYWGRGSVAISGHDENNIVVSMRRAGLMSGRIVMEIDPKRPTPSVSASALLHLEPASGSPSLGWPRNDYRPDGPPTEFTIQGLLAGEYLLRSRLDWVVKSITWKGRDYTETPFDAAASQDFSGVEVTVTNAAPTLTGTVRGAQGAPADGAVVVFFPVDPARWVNYGLSPARIKSTSVTNTGSYRVTTLPAGDYYAIAVNSAHGSAWLDPEFFRTVAPSATRVSVSWGEAKAVDLALTLIK